jgi:hypothetical protein
MLFSFGMGATVPAPADRVNLRTTP